MSCSRSGGLGDKHNLDIRMLTTYCRTHNLFYSPALATPSSPPHLTRNSCQFSFPGNGTSAPTPRPPPLSSWYWAA